MEKNPDVWAPRPPQSWAWTPPMGVEPRRVTVLTGAGGQGPGRRTAPGVVQGAAAATQPAPGGTAQCHHPLPRRWGGEGVSWRGGPWHALLALGQGARGQLTRTPWPRVSLEDRHLGLADCGGGCQGGPRVALKRTWGAHGERRGHQDPWGTAAPPNGRPLTRPGGSTRLEATLGPPSEGSPRGPAQQLREVGAG